MKKIKTLTIILSIVLVTMIAFLGVYVQVQNRMENQVKDYTLSTDFKGTRTIRLKVSDETKEVVKDAEGNEVETEEELTEEQLTEKGYTKEEQAYNPENVLTLENYKKSKEIIEKRLENQGISYYEMALDEQTGEIVIQIPENSNTDNIVSNIDTVGKFEIKDSQTNEVLMDNNDIKLVNVMYGSSSSTGNGTSVYLNIEFTKEGAKKLELITSTYVPEVEDTTEEKENSEDSENTESEEKKISLQIDNQEMINTNFEEPIKIGKLRLSIGSSSTDTKTLQGYVQRASSIANILNYGKMPVKYEVEENKYVLSDITEEQLQWIPVAIAIVIGVGAIIFIVKYKMNGLLGAITTLGLAAIYMLILRYANVTLSITGVFGIFVILLLNSLLVNKILQKIKENKEHKTTKEEVKEAAKESYKEFFLKMIPICISVIVFCFINWTPISSFGMVMFWGIALIAIYNLLITNSLLRIKANQ